MLQSIADTWKITTNINTKKNPTYQFIWCFLLWFPLFPFSFCAFYYLAGWAAGLPSLGWVSFACRRCQVVLLHLSVLCPLQHLSPALPPPNEGILGISAASPSCSAWKQSRELAEQGGKGNVAGLGRLHHDISVSAQSSSFSASYTSAIS